MRSCSVEGCGGRHEAHGYCEMHYRRWRRHGDAATVLVHGYRGPLNQRVLAATTVLPSGCWVFTGALNSAGYARVSVDGRKRLLHRVAHELLVGPIPAGLDVDHRCHNNDLACAGGTSCSHRACWRPDHLTTATRSENTLRGRVSTG